MSESSSATVRADILQKYSDLFGTKTVNGRQVHVEELIARLSRSTRGEFASLMQARHQLHNRVAHRQGQYHFLDASTQAGRSGRQSRDRRRHPAGDARRLLWTEDAEGVARCPATVPIPADVTTPGLEGTGPSIDLGMAFGALNSGASQWMWDWEDAGGDYKAQLYEAWANLKRILAHEWDGKLLRASDEEAHIPDIDRPPPENWPTIFHRVAGPAPAQSTDPG